ncbi:mannitol-1-phosphatase [Cyclospora cayetanensis]|nr:mannitol-1-phosphatase [Cyclospora cayetanensis]
MELEKCYATIRESQLNQRENYVKFLQDAGKDQIAKWQQLASEIGIGLDVQSGRIRYKDTFEPLDLHMEVCYIRHGKTEGNTEPRVYQGQVDYQNNQLNNIGLEQAATAAERLEKFVHDGEWSLPDLVVSSPLQRAQKTALPFLEKHKDIEYKVLPEVAEMKFGAWDNLKVAELPATDIGHLFYLEQNALVKSKEPHRVNLSLWTHPEWLNGQKEIEGENFLECMQRQREALRKVEKIANEVLKQKCHNELRKPRVVLYGHSMAGAAVSILLGFGKADASGWLGFDGNYIMPNATPTLLIPGRTQHKQA